MMKFLSIPVICILLFTFSPIRTAEPYTSVSLSFSFHDVLAPYGTWVEVSNYGHCWRPGVSPGWRPYVNGYWAFTSYGPTWYGPEPWAWCAYHYGNWVFTPEFGWVWVPGYEWHAGRVEWAVAEEYIGWRPAGYNYGSNVDFWIFIDGSHFGSSDYSGRILRTDSVRNLFNQKQVRVRSSIQREEVERITQKPVRVVSVKQQEIQVNGKKARLVVTADEESRIREHVSRVNKKTGPKNPKEKPGEKPGKDKDKDRSKPF